jgi:hypothetical protein
MLVSFHRDSMQDLEVRYRNIIAMAALTVVLAAMIIPGTSIVSTVFAQPHPGCDARCQATIHFGGISSGLNDAISHINDQVSLAYQQLHTIQKDLTNSLR